LRSPHEGTETAQRAVHHEDKARHPREQEGTANGETLRQAKMEVAQWRQKHDEIKGELAEARKDRNDAIQKRDEQARHRKTAEDFAQAAEQVIRASLSAETCAPIVDRAIAGLPAFPAAQLLVFWGGMQQGFNGLTHNPVEYARRTTCPVLLLHGTEDTRVSAAQIQSIYKALGGEKHLYFFKGIGHESYVSLRPEEWKECVAHFLHSRVLVE